MLADVMGVRRAPESAGAAAACVASPEAAQTRPETCPVDQTEPHPTVAASAEDLRLVSACLAAEARAWDEFVDRFAGLFVHIVEGSASQHRLQLQPTERDDLVAEILTVCGRDGAAVLRGFAGRSSLATYLSVVARRVVVPALSRLAEATGAAASVPGAEPAANREQTESLMRRLDAEEAILVRLHHLEGRSYGEISSITGMPLGAIGPALSRAKAKMRA